MRERVPHLGQGRKPDGGERRTSPFTFTIVPALGEALIAELLDRFARAISADDQARCLRDILDDKKRLGPVAKNIVSM